MDNSGIDRSRCSFLTPDGVCPALNTKCTSVANSLCVPINMAYNAGVYDNELKRIPEWTNAPQRDVEIVGKCPFCGGIPELIRPNWFRRVILGVPIHVRCHTCKAVVVAASNEHVASSLSMSLHDDGFTEGK